MNYKDFIIRKSQLGGDHGFEPVFMPDMLFDFQKALVEWNCRKGCSATYADCGTGKTFIQLVWAENVARHSGGRVLILTPLAVAFQTVREGAKIGVDVKHRREGIESSDRIVVTNYERLHKFNPSDFAGCVCDESSILKNFDGETRKAVTEFMLKLKYRLLCTATAAPNDWIELGTSSEALGDIGATDMINKFFKKIDQTCTARQEHMSGVYRLRPHAEKDFWRWVCSWARAVRKPSDMGFPDGSFKLPELITRSHVVKASKPRDGFLFDIPAVGLSEQRSDLRNTISERCGMAADLVNARTDASVVWCNLNEEGKRLAKIIKESVEVSGEDSEEFKEKAFSDFISGNVKVLITKPKIGGFGLNLQHCCHQTYFPSHSYEQYYQSVRRCWRFGQKNPVTVDMITTDGQDGVMANLKRKSDQADKMFSKLVEMMWSELKLKRENKFTKKESLPSWL
jgi:hypothetical protein